MDGFLPPPVPPADDVPPNPEMPDAPVERARPKRRLPPPPERPSVLMPSSKKKARLPAPLMKATPKHAPAAASANVAGHKETVLDLGFVGQRMIVEQEFSSVALFFQRYLLRIAVIFPIFH